MCCAPGYWEYPGRQTRGVFVNIPSSHSCTSTIKLSKPTSLPPCTKARKQASEMRLWISGFPRLVTALFSLSFPPRLAKQQPCAPVILQRRGIKQRDMLSPQLSPAAPSLCRLLWFTKAQRAAIRSDSRFGVLVPGPQQGVLLLRGQTAVQKLKFPTPISF